METNSVMMVGVGGQGILLSSKLLTRGLLEMGYDVKMSEIHGMSQRGGSVSADIRYGDQICSPVISEGGADILLSFEEMETYRWLRFVKPQGRVILNAYRLPSAPILAGRVDYPEGIIEEISREVDTVTVHAVDIALRLGETRSMNMVLLGALIGIAGLDAIDWGRIIEESTAPRYLKTNLKALESGIRAVSQIA